MSKRTKYTAAEKYEILMSYEAGAGSMREMAFMYNIDFKTFQNWRYAYGKHGIEGLVESLTCKKYSDELKEQAVKEYLSGKYSQNEVARKYELSGKSILMQWVNKYNSHRDIKATAKGMSQSMTKERTTSWKEKIEIVLYCIANNKDYRNAAEVYHISYQQIYQWVRKYESEGADALKDRRGRKKNEEELTPEERVALQVKRLEAENERLRAENAFLKKLKKLERR